MFFSGVWCNRKCRECSLVGYGATGSVGSVLYGVWCNRKCRECSLVGFGATGSVGSVL